MLHLATPVTVQHTDLQARKKGRDEPGRDEHDVKMMMSMLEGSCEEQNLATPAIEKDLIQAEAFGEKDRLESDPPKGIFTAK